VFEGRAECLADGDHRREAGDFAAGGSISKSNTQESPVIASLRGDRAVQDERRVQRDVVVSADDQVKPET
jgi:hypothetical protein